MLEEIDNDNFEKLIRSKIEDCETFPDSNVWNVVKKSLTYRRRVRYLYVVTASVAAAATVFFASVNLQKSNNGNNIQTVSQEIVKELNSILPDENIIKNKQTDKNSDNKQNTAANTAKPQKTEKLDDIKKHAKLIHQINPNMSGSEDNAAKRQQSPVELQTLVADNPPQKDISKNIKPSQDLSGAETLAIPNVSNLLKNAAKSEIGTENPKTESIRTKLPAAGIKSSMFTASVNFGTNSYQDIIENSKNTSSMPVVSLGSSKEYVKSSYKNDLILPDNVESQYGIPFTAKFSVRKNLNKTVALETGLSYTNLLTKYRYSQYTVKQRLHYLGIPFSVVYYAVSKPDWNLYASAGGAVERGIYTGIERNDNIKNPKLKMKGVQLSANIALGASYTLYRNLGAFVEPQFGYFFDSGQPESIRTASPLSFGLGVGLRYGL